MKYTLKLSTKHNVYYREIDISELDLYQDQTVIKAELISVMPIFAALDTRLGKPSKNKYWLWDISNNGRTIFKSHDYMNDMGIDTSGNKRFPKEALSRKHENEWVEV